jgi:hypothetical protein
LNSSDKRTVGSIIQENNDKNHILEDDIRAYTEAIAPNLIKKLYETAEHSSTHPLYYKRDFYIVLVKNVDRVLGQPKFQIWARRSCPTPVYKQDVWKYHHIGGDLEYLWSIPSASRYWDIVRNKSKYLESKTTRRLARFVLEMESGALLEWVKKENGELPDAVILLNKGE